MGGKGVVMLYSVKLLYYMPSGCRLVNLWSASKVKVKPAGSSSCWVVLDGVFENVEMVVIAWKTYRNRLEYLRLRLDWT
jgi:hypothetical protein